MPNFQLKIILKRQCFEIALHHVTHSSVPNHGLSVNELGTSSQGVRPAHQIVGKLSPAGFHVMGGPIGAILRKNVFGACNECRASRISSHNLFKGNDVRVRQDLQLWQNYTNYFPQSCSMKRLAQGSKVRLCLLRINRARHRVCSILARSHLVRTPNQAFQYCLVSKHFEELQMVLYNCAVEGNMVAYLLISEVKCGATPG